MEHCIENAWSDVASFVPKFVGFLIILLIGYFVAKLIAKAVNTILERVGFDKAVERGGVKKALERSKYDASDILAKVVFYALFLIVLQMAFGVFGPNPISDLLEGVIAYLPKVIAAILIIVIASAIAAAARELIDASLGGLSYGPTLANATGIAIVVVGIFAALNQLDRPGDRHRPVLRGAGDRRRLGRHRHRRRRHRPDALSLGQRSGPLRRREAQAATSRPGLQGPHRPARPATRRPGPNRHRVPHVTLRQQRQRECERHRPAAAAGHPLIQGDP
jgi:Mechanosensitive ion channel, conserved TM helix